MSAEAIHDSLMHLSRLLLAEAREGLSGLQPVQLQALQYLSHCNRYSDTPAAVADFLGATRGTVSQSLRVLEERGLVAKRPDPEDRRVVHLSLTPRGDRLREKAIPPAAVEHAVRILGRRDAEAAETALRELLRALQRARGGASFGVCRTCTHFRREAGGFRCGLTLEPLSLRDSGLLCREHGDPD